MTMCGSRCSPGWPGALFDPAYRQVWRQSKAYERAALTTRSGLNTARPTRSSQRIKISLLSAYFSRKICTFTISRSTIMLESFVSSTVTVPWGPVGRDAPDRQRHAAGGCRCPAWEEVKHTA